MSHHFSTKTAITSVILILGFGVSLELTGCGSLNSPNDPGNTGAHADSTDNTPTLGKGQTCKNATGPKGEMTIGDWVTDHVIDGDTVSAKKVSADDKDNCVLSKKTSLRPLGVNAPEVAHNKEETDQCGGQASKKWLTSLLPAGTTLALIPDPNSVSTDKYGRPLGYVMVHDTSSKHNGEDLSDLATREGYAVPWVPSHTKKPTRYQKYEINSHEASEQRAGNFANCSVEELNKHG